MNIFSIAFLAYLIGAVTGYALHHNRRRIVKRFTRASEKFSYIVGPENADYITDGIDDDVQIQRAIDDATLGTKRGI